MITCPVCRCQIPDNYAYCPRCGNKFKGSSAGKIALNIIIITLIVIIGLPTAIASCSGTKSAKKDRATGAEQTRPDEPVKAKSAEEIKKEKIEKLTAAFAVLNAEPELDAFQITDKKLTLVYKGSDLPKNIADTLLSLARSGSKELGNAAFTVECFVAGFEKMLHSITVENGMVLKVTYKRNMNATQLKRENLRLAAAKKFKETSSKLLDEYLRKEMKKAYEELFDRKCMAQDGSCIPVVAYVKRISNDPSSFEHVKTTVYEPNEDGIFVVTMSFRAKNGFGAKMLYTGSFYVSADGKTVLPK